MRTTIDLPDDLLREAKERSARERRSLSEVVADAVRATFARTDPLARPRVVLPTHRGSGARPGVDLDDSAGLLDVMEDGS
jgi:Arc/MetJ-type ribon-helix-helix transcriptional regulator